MTDPMPIPMTEALIRTSRSNAIPLEYVHGSNAINCQRGMSRMERRLGDRGKRLSRREWGVQVLSFCQGEMNDTEHTQPPCAT